MDQDSVLAKTGGFLVVMSLRMCLFSQEKNTVFLKVLG